MKPNTLLVAGALTWGITSPAAAATPTYWNNRAEFEATLTASVVDDYSHPEYINNQSNAVMSAVLGETDYVTTGFEDWNIITNFGVDPRYCAGCNGSFELQFMTTTVGTAVGVDAVGFDIDSHNFGDPYYAYITFADGDTDDIELPAAGNFWGVSAPEQIERIHVGLTMGESTTGGSISIDDLTIGSQGPQLCGNGELDEGEFCDEGGETATCDANCTEVTCGDGTWNATALEACDDGGDSADCNFDCTFALCGDLYVNMAAQESCDEGGVESATCDDDCTAVTCGDGNWNEAAGEVCDDGVDTATCDFDCSVVECGDGYLNTAVEDCDDDGESVTCNVDCTTSSCGDGVVNTTAGETCDEPKSAECDADCTAVTCGDGLVNDAAGEECDGDGKGTPGETSLCDEDCTRALCGDGVLNVTAEEECDDGNESDGDGCAGLCWIEAGSTGFAESSGSETGDGDTSGSTIGDEAGATTNPLPVDPTTTGADSSTGETSDAVPTETGCGCSTNESRSAWAFVLVALVALRRRRR